MDFNYLGFVRSVLGMNKQSDVSVLSTDPAEDAYKVQRCVNDTISDLSHVLNIKGRITDFSFATVIGQALYTINKRIVYPLINLRQKVSDIALNCMSAHEFDRLVPDDDSSGEPAYYYLSGYRGVLNQPTSETLSIVSSNAGDTSKVVIQGYDANDNYIIEELTLTGTSAATSARTYKHVESISKLVTFGNVTVTGSTSSASILVLNANETIARYPVVGLHPIPSSVMTIYGRGYAQIPTLAYANESPVGLDFKHQNAIILGSFARYMRYNSDSKIESIESAFESYYAEIEKILLVDKRDPDKLFRMKGAGERRVITTFKPLDILNP
jgi:hypothetical protein